MDIQSCVLSDALPASSFNVPIFVLMLVLVVLSAFFSMSETAFSSASDTKLRIAVEGKVAGAKKAIFLYERFDRTVTTLLIGNNLVNVALSTIAVFFFTQLAISNDENVISFYVVQDYSIKKRKTYLQMLKDELAGIYPEMTIEIFDAIDI